MRIGDLIECSNERDLKQTINALELGGVLMRIELECLF